MPSRADLNANLVYPVFRYGLRLKERLRLGRFNMAQEQAELKRLIKAAEAAGPPEASSGAGERYLGVGYPLACWLDDVFILDPTSPWAPEWRENTMESALYGENLGERGRDRAWKFWAQAAQAEARADENALEVFYLCMMLGFRGDFRDDPRHLQEWRERLEAHLPQSGPDAWPDKPLEKPIPPPDVPPLEGRERLRWLMLASGLVAAGAIVAMGFLAVYKGIG